MSRPLPPLHQTPLTPREAADCLRGIAELVETYPATGVLLTLDVAVAQTEDSSSRKRRPTQSAGKSS